MVSSKVVSAGNLNFINYNVILNFLKIKSQILIRYKYMYGL